MRTATLPTGEEVEVLEESYSDEYLVRVVSTGEKRSVPKSAIDSEFGPL